MAETSSADGTNSEVALIRAAQGGDYGAFESLVDRYRDRVYRLALTMTKNANEAEEVSQEAFLQAFRSLGQFRGDSSVGSWLYRIATNASLMRMRQRRRKPLLSIEDHESTPDPESGVWPVGDWSRTPDEQLLDQELRDRLDEAIADLPEKYRLVLLLRDVEGRSGNEVASTLGLTLPTVKARLHRGRLFVREALERYFEKR